MEGDIQIGRWLVQPKLNSISGNGKTAHVEPRAMQVLVFLAQHAGDVMPKERIIQAVWAGTFVTDDVLTRAISELRKAFEDDPHQPRFIQTIAKSGYRLIARVEAVVAVSPPTSGRAVREPSPWWARRSVLSLSMVTLGLAGVVVMLLGLNVANLRDRLLGRAAAPHIESLAVLPLANLSGDPQQEYFADGMTEELITTLGKVSALRVISRTSVMQYKQTKKALLTIARELNVDAVVEGSVLRFGSRVRITAQLIQVRAERQLWAESYERDLRDILALQSEVAQAITNEIKIKLTPQEQTRLASSRPVNPEAYKALLKAEYYASKWPQEEHKQAFPYIQEAIALDPTYAPSYAALAHYYLVEGVQNLRPVKEAAELARAAALKALELDQTLARSHHEMGGVKLLFDWDWSGAEQEMRCGVMLGPNNSDAHNGLGMFLMHMGRNEEAIPEARKAVVLDPLRVGRRINLGWALFYAHKYDESIEQFKKALDLAPHAAYPHYGLGCNYLEKGMIPEALAACQRAIQIMPDQIVLGNCGMIYGRAGQRHDALALLDRLRNLPAAQHLDSYNVAMVYDGLGNEDRTMQWLERAFQEHSTQLWDLKIDFWSDKLRSDPRFQDLLRRMDFPE